MSPVWDGVFWDRGFLEMPIFLRREYVKIGNYEEARLRLKQAFSKCITDIWVRWVGLGGDLCIAEYLAESMASIY